MFVRILVLMVLFGSEVALGISNGSVARKGAIPVGKNDLGEPIYLASDLLPVNTQDLRPDVSGGIKSEEGEFPAMGMLSNCSATLVGPKVIFTASHCQTTGTRISFKHRGSGKSFAGVCTRHPQVDTRNWFNDYTLCVLDEKVPDGTQFASFYTANPPARGDTVVVNGGGLPNFGVHYHGNATVTGMSGQDIVTCGPAGLTNGDSGGSLEAFLTDFRDASKFLILGVNSRGDGRCSYYNTTSSNEFKSWATTFAIDKGIEICGINKDCAKPSNPSRCADEYSVVAYLEKALLGAKARLAMCEK